MRKETPISGRSHRIRSGNMQPESPGVIPDQCGHRCLGSGRVADERDRTGNTPQLPWTRKHVSGTSPMRHSPWRERLAFSTPFLPSCCWLGHHFL